MVNRADEGLLGIMVSLHILNGDATLSKFSNASIPGDTLAWREMLMDGPVSNSDDEMWKLRERYITETYGGTHDEYQEKVLSELKRLDDADNYDEITLWFEYDLFCQVNHIYLLNRLSSYKNLSKVTLVCPNTIHGIENFRGLGELEPGQMAYLYTHRINMTEYDLMFAQRAWEAYTYSTPEKLMSLIEEDMGNLYLLKAALLAHFERFPSLKNGLNTIEKKLMLMIADGYETQEKLLTEYFKKGELKIYGIGNLQVINYLKRLSTVECNPVFNNGKLVLTDIGNALLSGMADFITSNDLNYNIGGVNIESSIKNWRYDNSAKKLILT